jgi:hypothetical protein
MSNATGSQAEARIGISSPSRFTAGALTILCAFGLPICAPVVIAVLLVSTLKFSVVVTFAIPVAAAAIATYFLPTGFGNPFVRSLVRSFQPAGQQDADGFVVQLTLSPRICSGPRAMIEDADDFGWLSLTSSGLVYRGDAVSLFLPYDRIHQVQCRNIGWRGLFLLKHRIAFQVSELPNVNAVEFAERSSWTLPASRVLTGEIFELLSGAVAAQKQ